MTCVDRWVAGPLLAGSLVATACAPAEPAEGSSFARTKSSALDVAEEATLGRRIPVLSDLYGRSLALSGHELLVGAPSEPDAAPGQGAAYAFFREYEFANWRDRQRLVAPDGAQGDAFGTAVAIDGMTALVGAPGRDGAAVDSGAVYVYTRSDPYTVPWSFVTKLAAADAAAGDRFGAAISLSGNAAIVGAPGKSSGRGAAYVFTRNGNAWAQSQKLEISSAAVSDAFGQAVAIASGADRGCPGPRRRGFRRGCGIHLRALGLDLDAAARRFRNRSQRGARHGRRAHRRHCVRGSAP